jgi:hypothetical protein
MKTGRHRGRPAELLGFRRVVGLLGPECGLGLGAPAVLPRLDEFLALEDEEVAGEGSAVRTYLGHRVLLL